MVIIGTFSPDSGILSLIGDVEANGLTIGRDAAGIILANDGAIAIAGGIPTVANTSLIQVFGLGGDDTITLDESNGALPRTNLSGGAGNDAITAGSANDMLFGQGGNDTLLGKGGTDSLLGGAGDDVLTGGEGDDQMFGQGGNDSMIWNTGDGSDVMEGGAGVDTAEVNGGDDAEIFSLTANGARVRFDRIDADAFFLDMGTTENLVLKTGGGNDAFSATGNLAALIALTIDGGTGNDTILGGNGSDVLLGGRGKDFVDGQQGNDTVLLGLGDDTFQWDPGDGSDLLEGEGGSDTMLFNGSAIGENIDISANGERVRFTRDIANIVMDLNDVERVQFNALGGADNISVHDLNGTDVAEVAINLSGIFGGSVADGQIDTIFIDGTGGDDVITFANVNGVITVFGLAADVTITNFDANDRIVINGLGGDDVIDASGLIGMLLTANGGDGDDILIGSPGEDILNGDADDDVLIGGGGLDVIDGGPGDNVVIQSIVTFQPDLLS